MSARSHLVVLPAYVDREPEVLFCGHCGHVSGGHPMDRSSRVCLRCELGLLVAAAASLAPGPDDAFLFVDGTLSVCGLSGRGEELLGVGEAQAVNRHVTELLVPADAEASGPEALVNLLVHAARGDGELHDVVVRPTAEYGIRHWARIGPCGPPRAALIVLRDGAD